MIRPGICNKQLRLSVDVKIASMELPFMSDIMIHMRLVFMIEKRTERHNDEKIIYLSTANLAAEPVVMIKKQYPAVAQYKINQRRCYCCWLQEPCPCSRSSGQRLPVICKNR
jgi:hypothetical protein